MWELDHKESWVPKNWYFLTVVLENTLESPLDCKEIQLVNPKGNQSWIFIGRTDAEAEAEAPILWPPDAKNCLIEKTLMLGKIEGRRRRGQQRMASPTQWTCVWASSGRCDGQGGLACCSPWGRKETRLSDWTELKVILISNQWCLLRLQIDTVYFSQNIYKYISCIGLK